MLPYISHQLSTLLFTIKKSMLNKERNKSLKNASNTHRESMRKSLNIRLEAARNNGNTGLVKQLEAEAKYLHL